MKRLLIDYHGEAVRTALMVDATLKEIFIDRKEGGSLVGQIILGSVKNILPSQFAFIDIGQVKNAFMNLSKHSALKTGQPVLVQVRKDASGHKGANVSDSLNFNGRLAILFESARGDIGVSHKITEDEERERLRKIAVRTKPSGYGVILRTNCAGKSEEVIQAELANLAELHRTTVDKSRFLKPPAVVYHENPLFNDLLADDIGEIWVNDAMQQDALRGQVSATAPALSGKVYFHDETSGQRLFDAYNVEHQIERALEKNVRLPCGGFVTIEQTEACVIVDVNTGKFAGRHNYRETVLQTNLEAAACVAEQIALRNLSGMIIVDFIDMETSEDREKLVRVFTETIKKDRIKTAIVGMTELGLMQLTRRKTREPLNRLLECECPHCHGTGKVKKG